MELLHFPKLPALLVSLLVTYNSAIILKVTKLGLKMVSHVPDKMETQGHPLMGLYKTVHC